MGTQENISVDYADGTQDYADVTPRYDDATPTDIYETLRKSGFDDFMEANASNSILHLKNGLKKSQLRSNDNTYRLYMGVGSRLQSGKLRDST